MPEDRSDRKQRRDEPAHPAKNKARRILSPEEEAKELARAEREAELAAASKALLRRSKERSTKAEDSESSGSWESADDDDDDDDDVDERFDEIDEEEIIVEDDEDEEVEDGDEDDEEYRQLQQEARSADMTKALKQVTFEDDAADEEEGQTPAQTLVWRGDQETTATSELQQSQKLDYSNKAYDSFFQLRTEYPCLSFDILHDNEGSNRTKYPLTMYFVCGSQADERNKNQLYVLRVSNVCRTKFDVESDEDSDDEDLIGDAGADSDDDAADVEELNGGEPLVDFRTIRHHGTANRVRCSTHSKQLCAVWSDAGHVQVFTLQNDFSALADFANWSKEQAKAWNKKDKGTALRYCTPSSTHTTEGYGLDWSTVQNDVFASGDCAGDLHVWKPTEDGRWSNTASSTQGNRNSIEEIKWSPIQADVLISGRAGGMVEVWDTRDMRRCQLTWRADAQDINVCDWNRAKQASHLLVTGADSGMVAVWDLRRLKGAADPSPIQNMTWHKQRITSVEFSLLNESVLSVTSDDGQCTLWDLSLERDVSEEKEVVGELFDRKDLVQLPDQLMFQHQGLTHPKEAHWHNQVPGMVVATDFYGLHLFKPMNWRSLMK